MTKCEQCGTTILFGPVRQGDYKFCSYKCRDHGVQRVACAELPPGYVAEKVNAVFAGSCPKCGGLGPVDVHTSHWVWSAGVLSSFKSKPKICCRKCGMKSRLNAVLFCTLFGWWGFPWGVFGTPAQILRNLRGSGSSKGQSEPTPAMVEMMRSRLASQLMSSPTSQVSAVPTRELNP